MLKVLNGFLVLALVFSAFVLYSLEHNLRKHERHVSALEREIRAEGESIKLLNAEWSFLIRPARLERLAAKHLELRQAKPYQLVERDDLPGVLPRRPKIEAVAASQDPIASMLKALQ